MVNGIIKTGKEDRTPFLTQKCLDDKDTCWKLGPVLQDAGRHKRRGIFVGLEETGKASQKSSICVGTSRMIRNVLGYLVINNKLN